MHSRPVITILLWHALFNHRQPIHHTLWISQKAEKWDKKPASKGHADAFYELARIYLRKCGEDWADSIYYEEAVSYLFTAYDMGNPSAKAIIDKIEGAE